LSFRVTLFESFRVLKILSWASEMGTVVGKTVHKTTSSQVGVVRDPL